MEVCQRSDSNLISNILKGSNNSVSKIIYNLKKSTVIDMDFFVEFSEFLPKSAFSQIFLFQKSASLDSQTKRSIPGRKNREIWNFTEAGPKLVLNQQIIWNLGPNQHKIFGSRAPKDIEILAVLYFWSPRSRP